MAKANSCTRAKTLSNMCHSFDVKYLPPEIWRHILATANLPVKTLLRFRCVCKSWCTIIDQPDFIYAFKRHKINSNTSKIFSLEALNLRDHGVACLLTYRQDDTLEITAHIFDSRDRYFMLGTCNELLLMGCYVNVGNLDKVYDREEMTLWNPSIRKSLLMSRCPLSNDSCMFGFAPHSKDYKVIAISYGQFQGIAEPSEMRVAVYTLSDQRWTIRNNNNLDFRISDLKSMFGSCYIPPRALFYEGAAHWIGCKPGYRSAHLISFNFDSEKFTFMEIPAALDKPKIEIYPFLLKESLAVIGISGVRLRIWVLEQGREKGVWTKWFSSRSNYEDFDFLLNHWRCSILLYHESGDERLLLLGDKSYNIVTGEVKEIEKSMGSSFLDLGMYTDSLVLWKGHGAENMTSLNYHM